jgi:hypothetical protein
MIQMNTAERITKMSECRQFGHAPCDAEYNKVLDQTKITCPRCRKSVWEKGDMRSNEEKVVDEVVEGS